MTLSLLALWFWLWKKTAPGNNTDVVGAAVAGANCPVIATASAERRGDRGGSQPRVASERGSTHLLNDAQKKQWKKMLGEPLDLGDWKCLQQAVRVRHQQDSARPPLATIARAVESRVAG